MRAATSSPKKDDRRNRRYGDRDDRTRRLWAKILTLLTAVTGLVYVVWAIHALNPDHVVVGSVFIAAELCCLGLFLTASIGVWRLRFKPKEGMSSNQTTSVDIFVPVCGEPLSMIRRTLEAVRAVRWNGKRQLYVLDDGGSDAVRGLAAELDFTYLSRAHHGAPPENAKAGNLNFGMANSSGELLLVMDADQVPVPHIIEAMAGYFRFPKVAFVQSKQEFLLPEGDPFFSGDPLFYEALQLGLDGGDAVISCGSGVLYRRASLEDIGALLTSKWVEVMVEATKSLQPLGAYVFDGAGLMLARRTGTCCTVGSRHTTIQRRSPCASHLYSKSSSVSRNCTSVGSSWIVTMTCRSR